VEVLEELSCGISRGFSDWAWPLAFGIINVMWLEASYFFGELDEERVRKRFQRGGRPID